MREGEREKRGRRARMRQVRHCSLNLGFEGSRTVSAYFGIDCIFPHDHVHLQLHLPHMCPGMCLISMPEHQERGQKRKTQIGVMRNCHLRWREEREADLEERNGAGREATLKVENLTLSAFLLLLLSPMCSASIQIANFFKSYHERFDRKGF